MRGVENYLLRDELLLSDPLFLSLLLTDPPDLTSLSTLRFWELTFTFDLRAELAVSPRISRLVTILSEVGATDLLFVLAIWLNDRFETALSGVVTADLRDTPVF